MTFCRAVILFLAGSGFMGCIKSGPLTESGGATFKVARLSQGAFQHIRTQTVWDIPREANYNFEVCLQDVAKNDWVRGQRFSLEGEGFAKIYRSTDPATGCFSWPEKIPFNYGKTPTYVRVHRTLTAEGMHRGSAPLVMDLNPWSGLTTTEPPMVAQTPNVQSVAKLEEGSLAQSMGISAASAHAVQILVRDLDVEISTRPIEPTSPKDRLPLNINLRLSPLMDLHNMAGESQPRPIRGRLQVSFYLINRTRSGETYQMTEKIEPTAFDMTDPVATLKVPLDAKVPLDGNVELALEVRAIGCPIVLKPLRGTFLIDKARSWVGRKHINIDPNLLSESQFKSYVSTPFPENSPTQKVASNPYFRVNKVSWQYTGVAPEEQTPVYKKLTGTLTVDVEESASGDPIPPGRKFKASLVALDFIDEGGAYVFPHAESLSGRLPLFPVTIDNFIYHQQKLRIYRLDITDELTQTTSSGLVTFNPNDSTPFYIERDFTGIDPKRVLEMEKLRASNDYGATLLIPFVRIERTTPLRGDVPPWEINQDLNVTVVKNYRFTMVPVVQRIDCISAGKGECRDSQLQNGWYQVTLAIVKNTWDQEKENPAETTPVLGAWQGAVEVKGGILSFDTRFNFSTLELESQSSLNQLHVQIRPLDYKKLRFDSQNQPLNTADSVFEAMPDLRIENGRLVDPRTLDRRFSGLHTPTYISQINLAALLPTESSTPLSRTVTLSENGRDVNIRDEKTILGESLISATEWLDRYRANRKLKDTEEQMRWSQYQSRPDTRAKEYAFKNHLEYVNIDEVTKDWWDQVQIPKETLLRIIRCGIENSPFSGVNRRCPPLAQQDARFAKLALCQYIHRLSREKLEARNGFSLWPDFITGRMRPLSNFLSSCQEAKEPFAIQNNIHVNEIDPSPKNRPQFSAYSMSARITNQFGVVEHEQFAASGAVTDTASVGFSGIFIEPFGLNRAFVKSFSIQSSNSSYGENIVGQQAEIGVEFLRAQFVPKSYQTCALLQFGYEMKQAVQSAAQTKTPIAHIYLCEAPKEMITQGEPLKIEEDYVWLNQACNENSMIFCRSTKSRLMFFVRGRRDLFQFYLALNHTSGQEALPKDHALITDLINRSHFFQSGLPPIELGLFNDYHNDLGYRLCPRGIRGVSTAYVISPFTVFQPNTELDWQHKRTTNENPCN